MAASVQGPEFDSAVAQLLGREATDVEERLDVLDRVHVVVQLLREQAFPDGTLTLRYGFVHILYQNALYAELRPTRKAAWSATAARAILAHYGEKSAGLAAELAMLFEAGAIVSVPSTTICQRRRTLPEFFAHHEAVRLARRGLALLQTLPDAPERARRELPLQVTLGMQLQVGRGFAAPEVEGAYARARALCEQLPEAAPLFLVLRGLWSIYEVRSELRKSRELADRLLTLAQRAQDPAQLIQARQALAVTSLGLGNPAATREHIEQGLALYDTKRHGAYIYAQDPAVVCLAVGAMALWLLGHPDQAIDRSREAVALAGASGQPSSTLALALHFGTILRQYRRERPAVQENADTTIAIATEHGLSFWLAGSQVMCGWALAKLGEPAVGVAVLRQGLAAWAATGAETYRTYFLGLLPEALGREEGIEESLSLLVEALALVPNTGEAFHEAELHRLRGGFRLRQELSDLACREAEACFRRALAIAQQQQAKSLELRAAMSLTRLSLKQDCQTEARHTLAACYDWFTEGFDTLDLQEAKALLDKIS